MAHDKLSDTEVTKLELNGRWALEELSQTTKEYTQLYGFAYSLLSDLPTARGRDIDYIYGKFPWMGGFSTVNFFTQLFHKIPSSLRPQVVRIQYASPGFIELQGLLAVALSVAAIIGSVCKAIDLANTTYRNVQKGVSEHKLTQVDLAKKELELTQAQIDFCLKGSKDLVEVFGLSSEEEALLDQRTQFNPLMKLKILLSVFRRAEPLGEKQALGLLRVTGANSDED